MIIVDISALPVVKMHKTKIIKSVINSKNEAELHTMDIFVIGLL